MLKLLARVAIVAMCSWAASVVAWPGALPQPDLSTHDFRNGTTAVGPLGVNVIGLGPTGNIYISGGFNSVDGQSRPFGVARLLPDGALDAWAPPLPLSNPRLAAESSTGTVALVFFSGTDASGFAHDALVHVPAGGSGTVISDTTLIHQAIAFDDTGALYAAIGPSQSFGGSGPETPAQVTKYTAAGAVDPAFSASFRGDYNNCRILFTPPYPKVHVMRAIDSFLYVGGDFLVSQNASGSAGIGGATRLSLASGDADPSWAPFGTNALPAVAPGGEPGTKLTCFPNPTGIVRQIVPGAGNTVYLAGSFDLPSQKYVARFSRTSGAALDTSWTPPTGTANTAELDPSGQYIYVATSLAGSGPAGADRNGVAAFSTAGSGALSPWDPGVSGTNGFVRWLRATSDRLVLGGVFSLVG
ncbi:MAG TPA: delta-60 repeat domain-containing protein, partial [Usitatibacter sp.]|nr:delta-60 repeat domain-containing protein [Usitatibacter sp.]